MEYLRNVADIPKTTTGLKDATVLIFKHSTTCGISLAAFEQLEQFVDSAAVEDTKVYVVDLWQNRDVSNELADYLDVHHASPQAIILKDGKVSKVGSHATLTKAWFAKWT